MAEEFAKVAPDEDFDDGHIEQGAAAAAARAASVARRSSPRGMIARVGGSPKLSELDLDGDLPVADMEAVAKMNDEEDLPVADQEDVARMNDKPISPKKSSPKPSSPKKPSPKKPSSPKKSPPKPSSPKNKKDKSKKDKKSKASLHLTGAIDKGAAAKQLNDLYKIYVKDGRSDPDAIIAHFKNAASLIADGKRPYTIDAVGNMISKLSEGKIKYKVAKPKKENAIALINEWVKSVSGESFLPKPSSPKKAPSKPSSPKKADSKEAAPKKEAPKNVSDDQKKRKDRKEKEEANAEQEMQQLADMELKDRYNKIKELFKPIERKRGGTKPNPKLTVAFLDKFNKKFSNLSLGAKWKKEEKLNAIKKWVIDNLQKVFSPDRKQRSVRMILVLQAEGKSNKMNLFYKEMDVVLPEINDKILDDVAQEGYKVVKGFKAVSYDKIQFLSGFDYIYLKKNKPGIEIELQ